MLNPFSPPFEDGEEEERRERTNGAALRRFYPGLQVDELTYPQYAALCRTTRDVLLAENPPGNDADEWFARNSR